MLDEDAVNTLVAEESAYQIWAQEQKNRILRMYNTDRKIAEWKRLFGTKEEPSDDYLLGDVF